MRLFGVWIHLKELRLRVNHKSFRQRRDLVLGCTAVRGKRRSIRMPLWRPLAKRENERFRDKAMIAQIHRRDGSAKSGIRHVARHAKRLISVGRHVPVEIHQLAERLYRLSSSILQGWRLTSHNRER